MVRFKFFMLVLSAVVVNQHLLIHCRNTIKDNADVLENRVGI